MRVCADACGCVRAAIASRTLMLSCAATRCMMPAIAGSQWRVLPPSAEPYRMVDLLMGTSDVASSRNPQWSMISISGVLQAQAGT